MRDFNGRSGETFVWGNVGWMVERIDANLDHIRGEEYTLEARAVSSGTPEGYVDEDSTDFNSAYAQGHADALEEVCSIIEARRDSRIVLGLVTDKELVAALNEVLDELR